MGIATDTRTTFRSSNVTCTPEFTMESGKSKGVGSKKMSSFYSVAGLACTALAASAKSLPSNVSNAHNLTLHNPNALSENQNSTFPWVSKKGGGHSGGGHAVRGGGGSSNSSTSSHSVILEPSLKNPVLAAIGVISLASLLV